MSAWTTGQQAINLHLGADTIGYQGIPSAEAAHKMLLPLHVTKYVYKGGKLFGFRNGGKIVFTAAPIQWSAP